MEGIMMQNSVLIRGLSEHVLEVLDAEAKRNNLSRNSLLQIIIETFSKNVELVEATDILSEPLEDVTKHLNKLTQVVTDSNRAVSYDIAALTNAISEFNLVMSRALHELNK